MQLEYIISGESNKETILFVHGAGANANQFEKQHEFFSDRYKVVSLSLRGHGGSPLPSPNLTQFYSLEQLANDIIELIDKPEEFNQALLRIITELSIDAKK